MQEYVADASPLIYLGRAEVYESFTFLSPIKVPPAVWREVVVAGSSRRANDVSATVMAEEKGILVRIELTDEQSRRAATLQGLGPGEREVLACAGSAGVAILDDRQGLRMASTLGLTTVSTLGLALLALESGHVTKLEARHLVDQIARVSNPPASQLLAAQEEIERYT